MLYPTLSQPIVFLCLAAAGLVCGLLFEIKRFISSFWFKHIFDFFMVIFSAGIFFVLNLHLNYGQFRFWTIFTFVLVIILERVIFAFFAKKWYSFSHGRQKKAKNN